MFIQSFLLFAEVVYDAQFRNHSIFEVRVFCIRNESHVVLKHSEEISWIVYVLPLKSINIKRNSKLENFQLVRIWIRNYIFSFKSIVRYDT